VGEIGFGLERALLDDDDVHARRRQARRDASAPRARTHHDDVAAQERVGLYRQWLKGLRLGHGMI
jgi:hypothetical protein